jgi:hypothetical protein
MWAAIHKCIEAMLGISLYSYSYLKLTKMLVFLIISYVFSSTKSENKRSKQILPKSVVGGRWPKQYIHLSKCKNDKIKKGLLFSYPFIQKLLSSTFDNIILENSTHLHRFSFGFSFLCVFLKSYRFIIYYNYIFSFIA